MKNVLHYVFILLSIIALLIACSAKDSSLKLHADGNSAILDKKSIETAYIVSNVNGKKVVFIKLKESGVSILSEFTKNNLNKKLTMAYGNKEIFESLTIRHVMTTSELFVSFDDRTEANEFVAAMVK